MAAKSKKVAAKKGPAKKSAPPRKKAKAVDAEVVSEPPDLMTAEVKRQISAVEKQIKLVEDMSVGDLSDTIEIYADQAARYSQIALKSGASALVYAWACGKLLNAAKARLGRGDFGKWRTENLLSDSLSERTTARYMMLAKQCDDVKSLLEWSPSLRQAYIACGILPEPERTSAEEGEDTAPKTHALLTSLSGLQKNLRLFTGSGEKLGKADLTQLKLMRDELDRFFEQVIPSGK